MSDPICDNEIYIKLSSCSATGNMTAWNDWRRNNAGKEIYLQKANFINGNFEGADFSGVHFEGAYFDKACLKGADFRGAHCEGAKFVYAHCEGAKFIGAYCEETIFKNAYFDDETDFNRANCNKAWFMNARCYGTSFIRSYVEEANFFEAQCQRSRFYGAKINETIFVDCYIDRKTDFRMTNISSAIIEPGKKALLERNIRSKNWEEWYNKKWVTPQNTSIFWVLGTLFAWILRLLLVVPAVRVFWCISDYGYSTGRVLLTVLFFILVFAGVYTNWPGLLDAPCASRSFAHMLCFSTATMVTLGFSNIHAAQGSLLGMATVTINLLVGYFMLAVLVTRLAVLFQTMAPGYVPKKVYLEEKGDDKSLNDQ